VLVSGLTTAVAVAAGSSHTCALLTGGTVRCWGNNPDGQIGDGTSGVNRLTPATVIISANTPLTNAVAIAAGSNHTCALLAGGTVACWGGNDAGQLGTGTAGADRLTPATVNTSPNTPLTNAVAITAGSAYTCALQAVGTVRCWGNNVFGELGSGDTAPSSVPVIVGGLSNAVAITAGGSFYTCALLANGTAKCWGFNANGQLGDGTTTNRLTPVTVKDATGSNLTIAVAITSKGSHTCALLANGTARCWGLNSSGQFGNGTTTSSPAAVAVGTFLNPLTNAVAITGGSSHTCALLADGSARCWGLNTSGQLGISNTAPSNIAPTPGIRRRRQRHRTRHCGRAQPHLRRARERHRRVLGQQRLWPARRRHHDDSARPGASWQLPRPCNGYRGWGCSHLRAPGRWHGALLGRQHLWAARRRHERGSAHSGAACRRPSSTPSRSLLEALLGVLTPAHCSAMAPSNAGVPTAAANSAPATHCRAVSR
jgi:alpha-tubulin suppressor-like RCC1 family protein